MKSFVRMSYPYILWIGLFIVAPMFMILLYAVTSDGSETVSFRFTLDNFARFFSDPDFLHVLWTSLRIAFFTTVFCILIGYPAALFISNLSEKGQTLMLMLMTLPMWINMLLKTYAWRGILLSTDFHAEKHLPYSQESEHIYDMPKVMSRKKQIIPPLSEAVKRIAK